MDAVATLPQRARQIEVLGQSLVAFDPVAGAMLCGIATELRAATEDLREIGVQLALLHTLQVASGQSGDKALRLRDRIDAMTVSPSPPVPVSQTEGD